MEKQIEVKGEKVTILVETSTRLMLPSMYMGIVVFCRWLGIGQFEIFNNGELIYKGYCTEKSCLIDEIYQLMQKEAVDKINEYITIRP